MTSTEEVLQCPPVAPLDSPLDALPLVHHALTKVVCVVQTMEHLAVDGSVQPLQPAFYHWVLALNASLETVDGALATLCPATACMQAHAAGAVQVLKALEALQTYGQ